MPHKFALTAIICEFDPFHFGHRLLLEKAREGGGTVCCVLSGNFTQRAAPAMLDQWARTRLALQNGADLVFQLPLPWACAGAERFAAGGVALAAALTSPEQPGRLVFGSEIPDAALLTETAKALLSPEFSEALKACGPNLSFAARRRQAVEVLLGPAAAEVLDKSNANLGVEYCKAILVQDASLTPFAIAREGAGHDGAGSASATVPACASELRARIAAEESIEGLAPLSTVEAVREARAAGRCPAQIGHLERAVLGKLRAITRADFARLPDLSEGLENRLYAAARSARSLDELYALAKSKRCSHARIRRLVLAAFLGLEAPLPDLPPYLRLLGCTRRGREVLGSFSPKLPIVARPRDVKRLPPQAQALWETEAAANDQYALCCPVPQPAGRDYTEPVIYG